MGKVGGGALELLDTPVACAIAALATFHPSWEIFKYFSIDNHKSRKYSLTLSEEVLMYV